MEQLPLMIYDQAVIILIAFRRINTNSEFCNFCKRLKSDFFVSTFI